MSSHLARRSRLYLIHTSDEHTITFLLGGGFRVCVWSAETNKGGKEGILAVAACQLEQKGERGDKAVEARKAWK